MERPLTFYYRSNTVQQVTVASDPSLNRGLEEGRRKDRALQRRMPVVKTFGEAIQTPMEHLENRQELVSEVHAPNREVRSVRSHAVVGRLKQKQLRRRRRMLNLEDLRRNQSQDAIKELGNTGLSNVLRGEILQNLVNSLEETSRPLDRRRMSRQLRPLRQGGIAGVAYDDIYLAIGVAATALFIIETLYKTYQLYNSAGRSLADSSLDLIEVWPLPS